MNFDDLLENAWQGENRPAVAPALMRRVRRRRWRQRLLRALELLLTLVAVLVFVPALARGQMSSAHWLLLPFYAVFLPVAWALALRAPRRRGESLGERVCIYAHVRLAQLRTGLRDLWLARMAAWGLLGYSAMANLGIWLLADTHWRSGGLLLLAIAVGWLTATLWLSATMRRRWLREYRAVRRLT
jgi:hypothetical protein